MIMGAKQNAVVNVCSVFVELGGAVGDDMMTVQFTFEFAAYDTLTVTDTYG